MGYFKRLDERVMAQDFERQATELQVRVSILTRFTQLRMPETVRVARRRSLASSCARRYQNGQRSLTIQA